MENTHDINFQKYTKKTYGDLFPQIFAITSGSFVLFLIVIIILIISYFLGAIDKSKPTTIPIDDSIIQI